MSTQMETCSHGVYKGVRCEACANEKLGNVEPESHGTTAIIRSCTRCGTKFLESRCPQCGYGKFEVRDSRTPEKIEALTEPRQPPAAPEMLRLKQAAMMLADGYESYRSEFQALTTPERILSILNCRADSLTEEATKQLMAETRTYFSAFGNPAVAVTPEYRAIANRTMKEWAKKFDALAAELKEQK